MRRRTRDWPLRVYRYWIAPLGDLPVEFWATARLMQRAWNGLVWALAARREAFDATGEDRAARRVVWLALEAECRALIAASGLDWVNGPDVLDRFLSACRATRWPRWHHRLDRLTIGHRFTGGGIPVARLFSERAQRVRLAQRPDDGAYATNLRSSRRLRAVPLHRDAEHSASEACTFMIAGVPIQFRILLHRPLPPGAIVKRVTWCGQRHVIHGWQWALAITVEIPPVERPVRPPRQAGLDIGWRVIGDAVRVGMLWDGESMCELLLPLDAPTAQTRRHHLPSSLAAIEDYQARQGKLLDAVKSDLRALGVPLPRGFALMRQGGVIRWGRTLPAEAPSRRLFAAWQHENDRLRSLAAALRDRLLGRRDWLYRNWARQLAERYTVIAWEHGLGIKAMAEDVDDSPVLHAAARFRQYAAPARFRLFLAQACAKTGTELLDCNPAYTTTTCHVCGGQATAGPALVLTCPTGHTWDQDENAARNLFSQIGRPSAQDRPLRKKRVRVSRQKRKNAGDSAAAAPNVQAG